MSTPPQADPRHGLLDSLAHLLIPLFKTGSVDEALARRMAYRAIEAYHPQTRADIVNIARIIAFSMAALAVVGKAMSPELPMPQQMRALGRANALNRSAEQSERTMMQRRAHPPLQPPKAPTPPPDNDPDDALVHAAVAGAIQEFRDSKAAKGTQPAAPPPESAQSPTEPFKLGLLSQSALPHGIGKPIDPKAAALTPDALSAMLASAFRTNNQAPPRGSSQLSP